ncbi:MAG: sigma-70 family RNA polymerase sigma factor [Comamonadaceae bacterium]|nr:MAG: sigma-70 family RNA polymerase sigma factor [Comamonadaceae bacterium]
MDVVSRGPQQGATAAEGGASTNASTSTSTSTSLGANANHPSSDDALMLAYAAGDADAFDMLYLRHEAGLYRFVNRLMGARLSAQVDEVFQDTWLRIVAARESFRPQGAAWRTWAFTIAHNLAMDRLRTSGRETPLHAAAHAGDHDGHAHGDDDAAAIDRLARLGAGAATSGLPDAAAHASAEELAFWRAAGRRLLACLDELPVDQRAVFLLHQEDGATVEALSVQLGIRFETVRSRLRYGLQKLRACMAPYLAVLGTTT